MAHLLSMLDVRPDAVRLRPASRFPLDPLRRGVRPARRARAASCMRISRAVAAEHGVDGPLLGLALDGYGYGDRRRQLGRRTAAARGCARGARLGHLRRCRCRAATAPRASRGAWPPPRLPRSAAAPRSRTRFRGASASPADGARCSRAPDAPMTTSVGRLFDAAAGLLGLCPVQHYEGQAAMELEALVAGRASLPGGFATRGWRRSISGRCSRALARRALIRGDGAELFHGTLIAGARRLDGAAAGARTNRSRSAAAASSTGCWPRACARRCAARGITACSRASCRRTTAACPRPGRSHARRRR